MRVMLFVYLCRRQPTRCVSSIFINIQMSCCWWLVSPIVADSALCTDPICRYRLVVQRRQTMTTIIDGTTFRVAMDTGGKFVVPETRFKTAAEFPDVIGKFVDANDVITADGVSRDLITVNDQFPGPTIEVLHESRVIRYCDLIQ